MSHARLFAFESDFVATLRCIPMAVRMKLDRCAIKLSLRQWSRFTTPDRRTLLLPPCSTTAEVDSYRARLIALVAARAGESVKPLPEPPAALWGAVAALPLAVIAFARSVGVSPPTPQGWASLTDLERFALLKLTRDHHDNVNFIPAMCEFGLIAETPVYAPTPWAPRGQPRREQAGSRRTSWSWCWPAARDGAWAAESRCACSGE